MEAERLGKLVHVTVLGDRDLTEPDFMVHARFVSPRSTIYLYYVCRILFLLVSLPVLEPENCEEERPNPQLSNLKQVVFGGAFRPGQLPISH